MSRVIGIGGIFFKSKDPGALQKWYQEHLGVALQDWGGAVFPWSKPDGMTVWNIFPAASDCFSPSAAPFMVNYMVDDLHGFLAKLRLEGCEVDAKVEESEFGTFGWVMDPDGNRIELWQPPEASPK